MSLQFFFSSDICICDDQLRKQFLVSHHSSDIDLCWSLITSEIHRIKCKSVRLSRSARRRSRSWIVTVVISMWKEQQGGWSRSVSGMCRGRQVREQPWLRVRHGVPHVKMVILIKTQTLTADLMTQVLSHAREFTCAEVRNVRRCGVVFTHTVGTRESPSLVSEIPCNLGLKTSPSIPARCLPPLICWLPPWRRWTWCGGRIPFQSSFRVLHWILRTVDSLCRACLLGCFFWCLLLQVLCANDL